MFIDPPEAIRDKVDKIKLLYMGSGQVLVNALTKAGDNIVFVHNQDEMMSFNLTRAILKRLNGL